MNPAVAANDAAVSTASSPAQRASITTAANVDRGRITTPVRRARRDGLSGEGGVKFLIRQQFHPVPWPLRSPRDTRPEDYTKVSHTGRAELARPRADKLAAPYEHASFSFPHNHFRPSDAGERARGCPIVRGGWAAGTRHGRRLRRRRQRQYRHLVESRGPCDRAIPRYRAYRRERRVARRHAARLAHRAVVVFPRHTTPWSELLPLTHHRYTGQLAYSAGRGRPRR